MAANAYHRSRFCRYLYQNTTNRSFNVCRNLICLYNGDKLTIYDRAAYSLHPVEDPTFLHCTAQLRHNDRHSVTHSERTGGRGR